MNKQEVREKLDKILERFDDGHTFADNFFGHIDFPRESQDAKIRFNGTEIKLSKSPIYGFEIFELAESLGLVKAYEKILVEEMPNGTSRIIGQHEQVSIHDYMNFSAISR